MNIKILGSSVVISIDLSMEDYETILLLKEDLLVLKDEEDNELFRISYTPGEGSVDAYGVSFDTIADGKMKVTAMLPSGLTREEITLVLTPVVTNLRAICGQIGAEINSLNAERALVASCIDFLD